MKPKLTTDGIGRGRSASGPTWPRAADAETTIAAFYQAHAVGLIRLAVAGAASRARRRTELDHFCVEGRDRVVGVIHEYRLVA
jgi:hypothetical protein